MAFINKKLIHFNTEANAQQHRYANNAANTTFASLTGQRAPLEYQDGDIKFQSIVYIKDTQKIWTHGKLYFCKDLSANGTQIRWNLEPTNTNTSGYIEAVNKKTVIYNTTSSDVEELTDEYTPEKFIVNVREGDGIFFIDRSQRFIVTSKNTESSIYGIGFKDNDLKFCYLQYTNNILNYYIYTWSNALISDLASDVSTLKTDMTALKSSKLLKVINTSTGTLGYQENGKSYTLSKVLSDNNYTTTDKNKVANAITSIPPYLSSLNNINLLKCETPSSGVVTMQKNGTTSTFTPTRYLSQNDYISEDKELVDLLKTMNDLSYIRSVWTISSNGTQVTKNGSTINLTEFRPEIGDIIISFQTIGTYYMKYMVIQRTQDGSQFRMLMGDAAQTAAGTTSQELIITNVTVSSTKVTFSPIVTRFIMYTETGLNNKVDTRSKTVADASADLVARVEWDITETVPKKYLTRNNARNSSTTNEITTTWEDYNRYAQIGDGVWVNSQYYIITSTGGTGTKLGLAFTGNNLKAFRSTAASPYTSKPTMTYKILPMNDQT